MTQGRAGSAYNAFKTVHFQRNKIKRRYLERAHIKGRTDVIRRQIGNNINILLSFCCAVEQGMLFSLKRGVKFGGVRSTCVTKFF